MKHPQQFLRDIEHANGGYDTAAEKAKYDRRAYHMAIAALVLAIFAVGVMLGAMI